MAYTSNKKPGGLDAAVSLAGTNNIVVDQAGTVVRATLNQVEAKVFDGKTQVTPNNGDVVVIRRGSDIRQVVVENMLPAGSVTNAMLGGSIADSKLNTINTAGKVTNQAVQAVSTNTANRIVTRDGSGNFAAGTITATLSGNATTATTLQTGRTIALTGDVTATTGTFNGSGNVSAAATIANGAVGTAKIANDAVDNTKIRNSAGLSVIGNSSNTTGNPADIIAGTDGHVLRRSGSSVGFGQVASGGLANGAVTTAKIGDSQVTDAKVASGITGTKINPNFGTQNIVAAGTASADKFIPTNPTVGQAGNGMYLNGANTLAFTTNGVEKLQITSNGNVGIGLGGGAPTQRLHILGGDIRVDRNANTDGAISFAGTTEYIYANKTNQAFAIGTAGANRLLIYNGGTAVLGNLDGSGSASFLGDITGQNLLLSGNSTVTGTIRSGGLPHFGCRAWVNFNGEGAIGVNQQIRGSGNVASVLKIAGGHYRINFTEAMPHANYCFTATTNASAGAVGIVTEEDTDAVPSGRSTTFLEIRTWNNSGGAANRFYINVAIFA